MAAHYPRPNAARIARRRAGSIISKSLITPSSGENRMKKLMLMLTAFGVAALAQPSFAQPAAPQEASPATSYSTPTEKHVKKPKKKKVKKGEASAASMAEPAAASQ
jgi:hypothetical protein